MFMLFNCGKHRSAVTGLGRSSACVPVDEGGSRAVHLTVGRVVPVVLMRVHEEKPLWQIVVPLDDKGEIYDRVEADG